MKFKDLYAEKTANKNWRLKHKDIDLFLNKKYEFEIIDVPFLFLVLDSDMNRTIAEKVSRFFAKIDPASKEAIFKELVNYKSKVNIDAVSNVLAGEDYDIGFNFFYSYIDDSKISCTDKFLLFDEIAEKKLPEECHSKYIEKIIEAASSTLDKVESLKGEVRMAVSTLRKIHKIFPECYSANEVIDIKYVKNEIWRKIYQEEMEYHHTILMNSYGDKVSKAIRNKDYSKVVRMLKGHEHELPDLLKKKLDFCLKKESKV